MLSDACPSPLAPRLTIRPKAVPIAVTTWVARIEHPPTIDILLDSRASGSFPGIVGSRDMDHLIGPQFAEQMPHSLIHARRWRNVFPSSEFSAACQFLPGFPGVGEGV